MWRCGGDGQVVGNAVEAGTYYAKVSTRDDHVIADLVEVEVVARLGELSEVVIEPLPSTEAGVSAAVRFHLQDGFDNIIMDDHSADIVVSVFETNSETPASYISAPWFDAASGEYLVSFLAGAPVQYTVSVTETTAAKTAARTFNKERPTWRELLTGAVPEEVRRFEAGAAADPTTGDVYLWGGASAEKGYLNDAWVLRGADPTAMPAPGAPVPTVLAYRRLVTVAAAEDVLVDSVVEVTVNTAALIAAGKMHHGCRDIYFTMPGNGDYLNYYVDTFAARGCNTASTVIYLAVPAGTLMGGSELMVEMYYGAPGHYWPNTHSNPSAVFAFYEGFEDGTAGAFAAVQPCTLDPSEEPGFVVEAFSEAYAGSYALHAPVGVRAVLSAPLAAGLEDFMLRAWFWDSNAHEAAHFVSPDYGGCGATAGADTLLPDGGPLTARSTAVGAYTLSHPTKYAVSSPWQSSGLDARRSAQWHRLEVMSTHEGGLSVSIDGAVVKTADHITLDKVLLSTGYSADGEGHAFLADAHAYFDEISVVPLTMCAAGADCVTATLEGAEEGVVKYVADMAWEPVASSADMPPPPARYGFTMVPHATGAYMFGGERSSYAFNDVWRFDWGQKAWSFVPPKSNTAPQPRFDHSAAVSGDTMWVYGGRTGAGEVLSDVWALDLPTGAWTRLAETTPMGARFGHSATFTGDGNDGLMYMYGGYAPDAGFSSAFFRCGLAADGTLECEDIANGCPDVATPAAARVSGVGLTPRSGQSMVPSATGLLLFGGSDDTDVEPAGVYTFVPATCAWSRTNVAAGEAQGSSRVVGDITRHDHAAVKLTAWMFVQGGVTGGGFESSTYVLAAP